MQQIGSAHDRGNPLEGVVDHHRELISMQPITAANDEIPNFC